MSETVKETVIIIGYYNTVWISVECNVMFLNDKFYVDVLYET